MGTNDKRLLFLTERFSPDLGGVSKSATRIAHAIDALGMTVDVLALTKAIQAGSLETDSFGRNSHIHRLGMFSNIDYSLQHASNVMDWLADCSGGYDAVWGHYLFPAGFLGVMTARRFNCKSVVSARGNDVDRLIFPPGDFARLKWTLENADVVTSVSTDLASKIQGLLGGTDPHVIYNVVDEQIFHADDQHDRAAELKSELGISSNDLVLGFCGELRHKKGLPFLLSAIRELSETRNVKLLVIGDLRPRAQAALNAFGADYPQAHSNIVVTGELESAYEIARHLRLSDVFLLPSVWEGLPNALLEAMAAGIPCLASTAGGITDVIQHEENGFLLPIHQLHRLSTAIEEILSLPEDRLNSIVESARMTVSEKFSPSNEQQRLSELFEKLWA